MYMQSMPVNVPFRPSVTFQVRPPLLVLVDETCHAENYCTTDEINTTLCTAGASCAIAGSNRPTLLWPRRGPMIDITVGSTGYETRAHQTQARAYHARREQRAHHRLGSMTPNPQLTNLFPAQPTH